MMQAAIIGTLLAGLLACVALYPLEHLMTMNGLRQKRDRGSAMTFDDEYNERNGRTQGSVRKTDWPKIIVASILWGPVFVICAFAVCRMLGLI
jgi:hypothetical protein